MKSMTETTLPLSADPANVWQEWQSALRRYLARRVKEPADVDDLLHEIFLKVEANLSKLREPGRIAGWLYRIADTTVADYYRARRRWDEIPEELAAPEESNDTTAELAACLNPMINALPDVYRQAVQLSEIEGKTQKVVAQQLGLTHSAARSRVQRGREKLRAMMLACCHIEIDAHGLEHSRKDGGKKYC